MFDNVFLRIVLLCGLLLAFTTHAAIDGFVNASKPRPASIQVSSNESVGNDYYQVALAVKMMDVRTDANAYLATASMQDQGLPRPVWALACGLAFLSVMRRRLSR